jgi:hypothetical protein
VKPRRLLLVLLSSALLLAPAAAVAASAYTAVERVYAATGSVPPCRFSSTELEAALRETPTYDLEYSGDFPAAIQSALSARAAGACTPHRTAAVVPAGPPPATPRPPASVTAATASPAPWPLVLAASVLAAALLAGTLAAALRRSGSDPRWVQALRHSWREAEWRLSRSR